MNVQQLADIVQDILDTEGDYINGEEIDARAVLQRIQELLDDHNEGWN